jgi:hypothetical protein
MAFQRLLRLPIDPALVLPLGLAACAGACWLGAVTGLSWLGPALLLGLDLALLVPRRAWDRAPGPSLRGAVAPLLAIVALLAATQYAGNRPGPAGDFLLDPFLAADTAFHVGVTRELAIGYPPQVPGLAGLPLGYHLGTDLVRAAGLRWAGVDPFDSIARYDVTLFALALLLAVRGMAYAAGLRGAALALAGWTLLATDFSFLFAGNPQAHWWADLLRGNLLVSLFLANPVIPGLALTLGVLIAATRALDGEGRGWTVVAAVLALAVPFFKVFLGAHLLLALGLAALLHRRAPVPVVAAAVPAGLATLALALGPGAQTVAAALDPLDLTRVTRQTLGLEPAAGAALVAWSALWIVASLGLRLLGIPEAVSALRQRRSVVVTALSVLALSGWPIGLLVRVSAVEVLGSQRFVNDAAYLLEQSSAPLWIFTAAAVGRWMSRGGVARVALAAGALLLAFPTTVQFAVKKARLPWDPIPAAYVRAMRAVESNSQPGEVVLQRPMARFPPLPVILAGRRVVYERFTPYSTQFAPAAELTRRHERVFRFFRTTDRAEAASIARELEARLVVLYGADRVRFDPAGLLDPVHEEPQARVYRVTRSER